MKTKPFVSVIVPIYNAERYLRVCIDSILKQTYRDIEIVLIDDGSEDDSPQIIDAYAEKYPQINALHSENKGSLKTRLKGVSVSRGEYILFVDSDDWIDEFFVEHLVMPTIRDETIDISIGVYVGNHQDQTEKKIFLEKEPERMKVETALTQMFEEMYFDWSASGKLIRRDIISRIKDWWFYGNYGDDMEICWKVFCQSQLIYYVGDNGYHYRQHSESMTHAMYNEGWYEYIRRLIRIEEELAGSANIELKRAFQRLIIVQLPRHIIYMSLMKKYPIEKYKNSQTLLYNAVVEIENETENMSFLKDLGRIDISAVDECIEGAKKRLIKEIKRFSVNKSIYIYGKGKYGALIRHLLETNNILYTGFVVTNGDNMTMGIDELLLKSERGECCGVIIAMGKRAAASVDKKELVDRGIEVFSIEWILSLLDFLEMKPS